MANKKRKGKTNRPRNAGRKPGGTRPQGQGGAARQGGQGSGAPKTSGEVDPTFTSDEQSAKADAQPKRGGTPKQRPAAAKASAGSRPAGKPQKQSAASRRAAQRKAAKRRRQMTSIGVPVAIVLLIVVVMFAIGGKPSGGGGKVSNPSDIEITGAPISQPVEGQPVAPGTKVPAFSAPGLDGGTVSWEPGKPSIVNIWAAWCPHCQKELPVLNTVAPDYADTVQVVTIATGQKAGSISPEDFVAQNDITLPVAVDSRDKKLAEAMAVQGFPTIYLVKPDGTLLEQSSATEPTEGEMRAIFEELAALAGPAPASPEPGGNNGGNGGDGAQT